MSKRNEETKKWRSDENEVIDDFGKSSNWNTSKISSIIKDISEKLSKVFKKLRINNQNDYNKKTVLTQNVNNEDNKLLDEDEVYNNPKLHSKEQDEFEIPDGGNGIYVDSESTYVDTGCWSELKHSTGLGFRNAGQDPISTDHGNGGISNKNNGVSSNLSSGNNEKITSLRYPPRRQGDVEGERKNESVSGGDKY
ncbi:hypothetical protein RhiirA1_463668 [Rhizophagus irregularis]|uniref:Uncharacterized protein n=1 Tax=Rhizophagus irregularis TaxID=588596 RepID=A0A2N0RJL6_9GLOM|nr:hypothetical protein RhiirA1_463668 [Rhizophagus irregularis]